MNITARKHTGPFWRRSAVFVGRYWGVRLVYRQKCGAVLVGLCARVYRKGRMEIGARALGTSERQEANTGASRFRHTLLSQLPPLALAASFAATAAATAALAFAAATATLAFAATLTGLGFAALYATLPFDAQTRNSLEAHLADRSSLEGRRF